MTGKGESINVKSISEASLRVSRAFDKVHIKNISADRFTIDLGIY